MADALVQYETIDDSQIRDIMDGKPPTPPEGWEQWSGWCPGGGGDGTPERPRPAFGSATGNQADPQRCQRRRAAVQESPVAPALRRPRARSVAPVVMGVLNVTARFLLRRRPLRNDCGGADARARSMVASGAAIIDVGGESTRPRRSAGRRCSRNSTACCP